MVSTWMVGMGDRHTHTCKVMAGLQCAVIVYWGFSDVQCTPRCFAECQAVAAAPPDSTA
jgi:hypothetical protein